MSDEARYALMLSRKPYDGPRRHGKHCFCHECLQDEMNAKDERIEQLEKELAEALDLVNDAVNHWTGEVWQADAMALLRRHNL